MVFQTLKDFLPITLIRRAQKTLSSPFSQAFALGTFMVFIEALVESLASPVFVKGPEVYFLFGAMGILFSLVAESMAPP
ncbi:MAG: hypothetical protein B6240_15025 [Desulfobacteraceae bacterium 4572_87]|nr:MAG: hypothetical protein B6240_15025 [Desulfobacteraceae bacterium 4572_87]